MPDLATVVAYTHRKNRRRRQNLSAFDALIASPHDFGAIAADASSAAGLVLPADCILAVSLDDAWMVGDIVIEDAGGGAITAQAGVADQVVRLGALFRRGQELEVMRGASGPAGALSLYVLDRDRTLPIATATFSA